MTDLSKQALDSSKAVIKKKKTDEELKKEEDEEVEDWMKNVYKMATSSSDEWWGRWRDKIEYQGFSRELVLVQLSKLMSFEDMITASTMIALRGPKKAAGMKVLSDGKSLKDLGIAINAAKESNILTVSRMLSATADLAAYGLYRMKVPKRLLDSDCPAFLQFPAAGALLNEAPIMKKKHLKFCQEFSEKIGGEFNEDIYDQMLRNGYCDVEISNVLQLE